MTIEEAKQAYRAARDKARAASVKTQALSATKKDLDAAVMLARKERQEADLNAMQAKNVLVGLLTADLDKELADDGAAKVQTV